MLLQAFIGYPGTEFGAYNTETMVSCLMITPFGFVLILWTVGHDSGEL